MVTLIGSLAIWIETRRQSSIHLCFVKNKGLFSERLEFESVAENVALLEIVFLFGKIRLCTRAEYVRVIAPQCSTCNENGVMLLAAHRLHIYCHLCYRKNLFFWYQMLIFLCSDIYDNILHTKTIFAHH